MTEQPTGGQERSDPGIDGDRAPDPWKSFRGVMAGTLILEAIVVLLALPVVAVSHGGLTPLTGGYLIGLAVVLVLLTGIQGRPWAIWVNLAMQLVVIAGWAVHGAIGFIGVIFAASLVAHSLPAQRGEAPGGARPVAGPAAAAGLITPPSVQL